MNDAIRVRTYSRVKEAMATGAFPAETGASQIPEVIVAQSEGRLDFRDAERISAMRAMGKANNLFRNGKAASERENVIDYLRFMVKNEKAKQGGPKWKFPKTTCVCIAAVAVDEVYWNACPTCGGSGSVPLDFANAPKEGRMPMGVCGTCSGSGKRRYTTQERVVGLATAWAHILGVDDPDQAMQREIAADKRLHGFIEAIEWAKSKLLEAERMAVEGAVQMLERL